MLLNKIDYIDLILGINDYIKELIWNVANQINKKSSKIVLGLKCTDPQIVRPYSYISTIKLIGKSYHRGIEVEVPLIFTIHYYIMDVFSIAIDASYSNEFDDLIFSSIMNHDALFYSSLYMLKNAVRKVVGDFINYVDKNIKIAVESKKKIEEKLKSKFTDIPLNLEVVITEVNTIKDFYNSTICTYVRGIAHFALTTYNIKARFIYEVETGKLVISEIVLEAFKDPKLSESFLEQLVLADILHRIFDDS